MRLLMFTLLLLLLLPAATAVGVSPAQLDFTVVAAGYAEQSILLSNPRQEPIRVILNPTGGASSMVTLPESVALNGGEARRITITITPPADAAPGVQHGRIDIAAQLAMPGGTVSSAILPSMSIPITINVESTATLACALGGVRIPSFETTSGLQLTYLLKNTGTARLIPRGSIQIDGHAPIPFSSEELLPTRSSNYRVTADAALPEGEHTATVFIEGCGEREVDFAVLAPGSLSNEGVFTQLTPPAAPLHPTRASFRNTGERAVTAQFIGVLEQGGEIIQIVESENLLVGPGQGVALESLIGEVQPGTYELRGSIVYEGKHTPERSISVEILPEQSPGVTNLLRTPLIIMLIIGALLLLILKKRRRTA